MDNLITQVFAGPHYKPIEGDTLSTNQKKFVRDAEQQGHRVNYEYTGKHMRGRRCPAVSIFAYAPNKLKTTARVAMDFKEHKRKVYGVTVYAFS